MSFVCKLRQSDSRKRLIAHSFLGSGYVIVANLRVVVIHHVNFATLSSGNIVQHPPSQVHSVQRNDGGGVIEV